MVNIIYDYLFFGVQFFYSVGGTYKYLIVVFGFVKSIEIYCISLKWYFRGVAYPYYFDVSMFASWVSFRIFCHAFDVVDGSK